MWLLLLKNENLIRQYSSVRKHCQLKKLLNRRERLFFISWMKSCSFLWFRFSFSTFFDLCFLLLLLISIPFLEFLLLWCLWLFDFEITFWFRLAEPKFISTWGTFTSTFFCIICTFCSIDSSVYIQFVSFNITFDNRIFPGFFEVIS